MPAANPGQVYINGKCIDCNRPDGDDNIIIPMEPKSAASSSQYLTAGAVAFALLYYCSS
ncbi:CG16836 [Drosophila busckii]|uniref:CG16836 n=1 Tax=Drosophila busckii TaxID=30019 RepID=A0A0M5J335_DROBS|nr:CG16836 [Drosophila busckii]